jgi:hypothetical protein
VFIEWLGGPSASALAHDRLWGGGALEKGLYMMCTFQFLAAVWSCPAAVLSNTDVFRYGENSHNCKRLCIFFRACISMVVLLAAVFFSFTAERGFFMSSIATSLARSIIYDFFLLHCGRRFFTPSRFNKNAIILKSNLMRLLFRALEPIFPLKLPSFYEICNIKRVWGYI